MSPAVHRSWPCGLAVLLGLTACFPVPSGSAKGAATAVGREASPRVKPTPSAAQDTLEPDFLRAPASGTIALAGQVVVDARFAIERGAGHILAIGDTNRVGLDGATLIGKTRLGPADATLISNNGGGLIGKTRYGLAAEEEVAVINAAGEVIALAGGNVVAPAERVGFEGTDLVARDGASLVGHDGLAPAGEENMGSSPAGYRLAQVEPLPPSGTALPAAGMWVSVVDTHTGLTVPLGLDGAGKPVYTVYSDGDGRFNVHVPATVAANVRIVARAPRVTDPRLTFHVIVPARDGISQLIDDRSRWATRNLRYVMATHIARLVTHSVDEVIGELGNLLPGVEALGAISDGRLGRPALNDLKDALTAVGAEKLTPARRVEIALLAADRFLAELDLATIAAVQPPGMLNAPFTGRAALATIGDALEQLQTAAAARTAAVTDLPGFFASKPYILAANMRRAPGDRYQLERSSEITDFVIREYLTASDIVQANLVDHVLRDFGVDPLVGDQMRGAAYGLAVAIFTRASLGVAPGPDGENVRVHRLAADLIRQAGPAFTAASAPEFGPIRSVPLASEPPAPEPPGTVTTVAGRPIAGFLDGPGQLARFTGPTSIALDPAALSPIVYVGDAGNGAIRRLQFDAAGVATVTTVVRSTTGWAGGMVMDRERHLFVADPAHHKIIRLTLLADGSASVETLAGTGEAGDQIGKRLETQFREPNGLALDGTGHLYVVDTQASRVVRIDLTNENRAVEVVLGTDIAGRRDADHAREATITSPLGVAVASDGTVYVSTVANGIRAIAAPGGPDSPTHFVAGGPGRQPVSDGFWANAKFGLPQGLAMDPRGRVVVADGNLANAIRVVTAAGDVSTLAGQLAAGVAATGAAFGGLVDGVATVARFNAPQGVAVGRDGTVWVADTGNHAIRRIVPN